MDDVVRDVKELLPQPVSEETVGTAVQLTGGDPGEVVVLVTPEKVDFCQFGVKWDGPYTPVDNPIPIAAFHWKNLPKRDRLRLFKSVVKAIVRRRRGSYRTCRFCQETNPPEWLHGKQTCQGCAERHLGVAH